MYLGFCLCISFLFRCLYWWTPSEMPYRYWQRTDKWLSRKNFYPRRCGLLFQNLWLLDKCLKNEDLPFSKICLINYHWRFRSLWWLKFEMLTNLVTKWWIKVNDIKIMQISVKSVVAIFSNWLWWMEFYQNFLIEASPGSPKAFAMKCFVTIIKHLTIVAYSSFLDVFGSPGSPLFNVWFATDITQILISNKLSDTVGSTENIYNKNYFDKGWLIDLSIFPRHNNK